jgi:hypothetical protein
MVLCDAVYRDATTGKFTLLGTFSTVGAASYPAKVRFSVYFAVTDGLGPTGLRLRLVDAAAGITDRPSPACEGPVFEMTADLSFDDPLEVIESVVLVETTLPKPGLYHCELLANDELLMSRRLLAVQHGDEQESSHA